MSWRLYPWLMVAAGLVFLVSTTGMAAGREPFATWYFSFAWWSYILFADSWLAWTHRPSVLLRNPRPVRMLGLSVVIWVSFEVYNFRLHNWHYLDLPADLVLRWAGYAIAFATVLPGIFVTWRLLEALFPPNSHRVKALSPEARRFILWSGLAASLLPWIWPRFFFPFVWLGPTAFFAVVNYRLGGEGILRNWERWGAARLSRLVVAGGFCGILWELWNFWARSKWIYDIPFFDWLHLFEMPVAGFLGFLPFALECHEMYWVGVKSLDRLGRHPVVHGAVWLALTAYIAAVFWGIDRFTVMTFR